MTETDSYAGKILYGFKRLYRSFDRYGLFLVTVKGGLPECQRVSALMLFKDSKTMMSGRKYTPNKDIFFMHYSRYD